jgi:hypothetical protein
MRRWRYRGLIVLAVVAVLDLAARFAFDFDMARVTAFEAVLFLTTCVLLMALSAVVPLAAATWRGVDRVAAVVVGLAGVRAAVWASGAPVMLANLITLAIAATVALGYVVWRRWHRPPPPA